MIRVMRSLEGYIHVLKNCTDDNISLLHITNVDIYVIGSNSKFLSKDVITEFRGRGDEIHIISINF